MWSVYKYDNKPVAQKIQSIAEEIENGNNQCIHKKPENTIEYIMQRSAVVVIRLVLDWEWEGNRPRSRLRKGVAEIDLKI